MPVGCGKCQGKRCGGLVFPDFERLYQPINVNPLGFVLIHPLPGNMNRRDTIGVDKPGECKVHPAPKEDAKTERRKVTRLNHPSRNQTTTLAGCRPPRRTVLLEASSISGAKRSSSACLDPANRVPRIHGLDKTMAETFLLPFGSGSDFAILNSWLERKITSHIAAESTAISALISKINN